MTISEVKWYKGKGTIGIVLIKTRYSGYRAFIGVSLEINEDYDVSFIAEYGTLLPRHLAVAYFPKKIKEGTLYDGRTVEKPKGRRNTKEQRS